MMFNGILVQVCRDSTILACMLGLNPSTLTRDPLAKPLLALHVRSLLNRLQCPDLVQSFIVHPVSVGLISSGSSHSI